MVTVIQILVIIAFIMAILSIAEKVPLWVAVFLFALIELIRSFGIG